MTSEQGQELYEYIHLFMLQEEAVVIDFAGIDVITATFLNTAFGQLYRDLSSEQLRQQVQLVNMPGYQLKLLKRVTANARRFYGNVSTDDGK